MRSRPDSATPDHEPEAPNRFAASPPTQLATARTVSDGTSVMISSHSSRRRSMDRGRVKRENDCLDSGSHIRERFLSRSDTIRSKRQGKERSMILPNVRASFGRAEAGYVVWLLTRGSEAAREREEARLRED